MPTKAMPLQNGDNTATNGGEDEVDPDRQATKRSRKRQREKQRRTNMSNAFDELEAFMLQVEPQTGDPPDADVKKKRKKTDGGEDASGITRLELIGRAFRMTKRLHRENEQRQRIIANFQEKGCAPPSADNVSEMNFLYLSCFQ